MSKEEVIAKRGEEIGGIIVEKFKSCPEMAALIMEKEQLLAGIVAFEDKKKAVTEKSEALRKKSDGIKKERRAAIAAGKDIASFSKRLREIEFEIGDSEDILADLNTAGITAHQARIEEINASLNQWSLSLIHAVRKDVEEGIKNKLKEIETDVNAWNRATHRAGNALNLPMTANIRRDRISLELTPDILLAANITTYR